MHARRSCLDRFYGVKSFAAGVVADRFGIAVENFLEFLDRNLPLDFAIDFESGERAKVNDFRGFQGDGQFGRQCVGIDPERATVTVECDWGNNGNQIGGHQVSDRILIDPFDFAGMKLVFAAHNSDWSCADGVGEGAFETTLCQALHDAVRDGGGGFDCEIERDKIGDSESVRIADRETARVGEIGQLFSDSVDEHDADMQAPQDSDIEQQIRHVFVCEHAAVDRDHEDLISETRYVL